MHARCLITLLVLLAVIPTPIDAARVLQALPNVERAAIPACDTTWLGHSPSATDPSLVAANGIWDWDNGIAGTDSTTLWEYLKPSPVGWLLQTLLTTPSQLGEEDDLAFLARDLGNTLNEGNTQKWLDNEAKSKSYKRTGITGVWHRDSFQPSVPSARTLPGNPTPIAGSFSAWCGLRPAGDMRSDATDELTGNYVNGDLVWGVGNHKRSGRWPGYAHQWDQILYRDVETGFQPMDLRFRVRAELCSRVGGPWFNPDPLLPANLSLSDGDRLFVWVGVPREDDGNPNNGTEVYDTNRRWLSEVIDFTFSGPPIDPTGPPHPQLLYSITGSVSGDITVHIPEFQSDTVRIVFQVKTNDVCADQAEPRIGGFGIPGPDTFDSVSGGVVIDDVVIQRADESIALSDGFEGSPSIRPRLLIQPLGGKILIDPATYWITTGKPPPSAAHIRSIYQLLYSSSCGPIGSPSASCAVDGNVLVTSEADSSEIHTSGTLSLAISPTIRLHGPYPNSQDVTSRPAGVVLEYDFYPGTLDHDHGTFYGFGVRYMVPHEPQSASDPGPSWSDILIPSSVNSYPNATCYREIRAEDFSALAPWAEVDSFQVALWTLTYCRTFGSTQCGLAAGAYWDNVRVGLLGCSISDDLSMTPWDLFQDTFPVNEANHAVGSADFDTTTALVKVAGFSSGATSSVGVIPGDSLVARSPYDGDDTRVDLVFRILPGPGNYTIAGDMTSGLLEKDPSNPFWAAYLADPGPVGAGDHFAGTKWDPNTWNSARMDSADNGNLAAVVDRHLGVPVPDLWATTLHEDDPKFASLGISRSRCFLVDSDGAVDDTNVCCSFEQCTGPPFNSTWPPAVYPAEDWASTTTLEGTKILPDGYFTPGTHAEYFVRRSSAANPMDFVTLAPDTSRASTQPSIGSFDEIRLEEFAVLPDRWKAIQFGGLGQACILVVDAQDRRGGESPVLGTLDSLGFGKNNGAGRGWQRSSPGAPPDPDDPSNWVAANRGQKGLAFDWYDIHAAESSEAGRLGCRLAAFPPELTAKQCKQGPSPEMLDYYNTIVWFSGDLKEATVHDGLSPQEPSDDAALIANFLFSSSNGNEKAVWLSGDGVAYDLSRSLGQAPSLLNGLVGAELQSDSYREASANIQQIMSYAPLVSAYHVGSRYGLNNSCFAFLDVLGVHPSASGATLAAEYEDASHRGLPLNPGVYGASVYRPADASSGRFYSTLIDGFGFGQLLGDAMALGTTNGARFLWMGDALAAFGLCGPLGPVVAVGDLPGFNAWSGGIAPNVYPNPARMGRIRLTYSLAKSGQVKIRLFDVAGRKVHDEIVEGVEGANTYEWSGVMDNGESLRPGVYFCRLSEDKRGLTYDLRVIIVR